MSKPISELVDQLPTSGLTVSLLESLDFVAPGEWQNSVGFVNMIKTVTGETDPAIIQEIAERAITLFDDRTQVYQTALWLYQTVDSTDKALGATVPAKANIPLLGFINTYSKPNKAQIIDFSLKLVVELVAFCQISGIASDSIEGFVDSLSNYHDESLIRMVALICVDGLMQLGPDFSYKVLGELALTSPTELAQNSTFQSIKDVIPGNTDVDKLDFINKSLNSVMGWMVDIVSTNNLTQQRIALNLRSFLNIPDNNLNDLALAAFLDASTNYYEHTGTQTVARRLIERAAFEI